MKPYITISKGFSLIDIMVGLLIGAFAIIVMLNVLALSEGQKRTITGGSDAQVNGMLALYTLKNEILQSGYGINSTSLLGKSLHLKNGGDRVIAPVIINDPSIPEGTKNTDTLIFFYGNSYNLPVDLLIDSSTLISGDFFISSTAPFTLDDGIPSLSSKIYNLGDKPQIKAYRIYNNDLLDCDYINTDCSDTPGNWRVFISNIVSLRAEYGVDTSIPVDYIADEYISEPLDCYAFIHTVRFVIVARNNQKEKLEVTKNQHPDWMSKSNLIDLSNNPQNKDWKYYRYTVLQTEVPIRNISWLNVGSSNSCHT